MITPGAFTLTTSESTKVYVVVLCVDVICAVPIVKALSFDPKNNIEELKRLGVLVLFKKDFVCEIDNGLFTFGGLEIQTGDEEEEDSWGYDEDESDNWGYDDEEEDD